MERFRALIDAMPLEEQAFTTKKTTWDKYNNSSISHILSKIFDNKDTVQISRADLFEHAKSDDIKTFIVHTILWGYPRGMRGDNFKKIIENIDKLVESLDEAKQGISDWSKHYENVKDIKGLGLATYSKFLYFLDVKIDIKPKGYKALILDNRIITALNNPIFKELDIKKQWEIKKNIMSYDSAKYYTLYLEHISKLADSMKVDSGKLEMFIFEFGLSLKLKEKNE